MTFLSRVPSITTVVFQSFRLCERCLAQTGKHCPDIMSYRNFGSAAWPMTEISHETYLQFDRDSLSPWACVDGWRLDTVAFDFLHMVYLGTGRDLFASGLRTLIERGVYEHTGIEDLDDLLDFIHLEMHRDCGEAGLLVYTSSVACLFLSLF